MLSHEHEGAAKPSRQVTHRERPIIMSGDNPKLIQERKTQTRRIMKPQPQGEWEKVDQCYSSTLGRTMVELDGEAMFARPKTGAICFRCPYGVAGDRIYVKETHWRYGRWVKNVKTKTGRQKWKFSVLAEDENLVVFDQPLDVYEGSGLARGWQGWHKRPSIFLSKKLARTWLEITKVRVERLKDISEQDCISEGVIKSRMQEGGNKISYWYSFKTPREMLDSGDSECFPTAKDCYHALWDSLHGKGAWDKNPWVWVIEFRLSPKGSSTPVATLRKQ